MLRGTIIYKYNGKSYRYNVIGVDNSTTCSLKLESGDHDAILMMSNNGVDEMDDDLWERRFDIELAKIKVQTGLSIVNGKKVKSPVNADMFCRLGALIRYAKSKCINKNEDGYTGIALASGEFEVNTEKSYTIHYPLDDDKVLAHVELTYGDIKSLLMSTDDFDIDLKTDNSEMSLFPAIKDGFITGIALNSEYLGFDLEEQVLVDITNTTGMYRDMAEIVKAHPDKEFSWLLKKKYIIVDDEHLDEICDYIYNWDGYVFYDTETTGLNITFKSRIGQADQLVGVVLSVKYGESFYFPTQMKSIKNLCNGDHWYFMEHYMRPILEGKKLVAHNMTFDWKVGYIYDINCNIVHDTMALIKLTLGTERKNFPMDLKGLTKMLLNRDSLELSDLVIDDSWGESDIRFWDLPYELVRLYACADTDNTNGLLGYAEQADLLNKYNARKVYEIEIAFSYGVAYQEFYGHRIDIDNLDKIRETLGKGQEEMLTKMVEIAGHEFNPNSSKQLLQIMYGELGIPTQYSRKSGRPTTDKDTLKYLSDLTDAEDNVKYPFCRYLLKYREYEGVRKIVDKFPEHITDDGYVFSSVMQYGTTTGRVSINSPNYQSYNDPIKKNVVPRPGFYMFDTDYSSVEYRVLGNMVGNERIKKSFEDPDFDYHAYQAAHMYNVPYSAVTKKLRKAAKGINFGLPYGMGDESLGVRVFGEASPENTRKASALRASYFKGQEDIRDWFEYHRNRGVHEGFTETFFGRRRYYHKQDFSEAAIRRQAGNQVIQGCVDGDTKIETAEFGIRPIKELVNYSGLVWNGTDWTHGDVLYSGKKQKCIITFTNGQKFICSPIHRFQIVWETINDYSEINPHWENDIKCDGDIGGSFVRCEDLKVGQAICINEDSDLLINDYTNRMHTLDCIGRFPDDLNEIYRYESDIPCVIVESVEITGEYIDMYDVCNTDCGYYVADGLITHNTAADIYKIAVGRVFKRICKEGWLGKVLFTGFVHDELLGEVSNDIDPGIFLKVLREEFEVKITNTDGSPWCPLYMGFGYGMSWYEAKTVELPIKFQWELVDKYGDKGYPNWDGDGRKFCDAIPDRLREFDVRDIRNQLLDKDSQGKEIKPTLNNQLIDCIKYDLEHYEESINNFIVEETDEFVVQEIGIENYLAQMHDKLCEYLDRTIHVQELYTDSDGNYKASFESVSDTQEYIDVFCKLHKVDRSLVNLLNIAEFDDSAIASNSGDITIDYFEEDEEMSEENKARMRDFKIKTLGVYVDIEEKYIILMMLEPQYTNFIKTKINRNGDGYKVYFKDMNSGKLYETPTYLSSDSVNVVQEMYIQYLRQKQLAAS